MVAIKTYIERPFLGTMLSWGVRWNGELVTKDPRKSLHNYKAIMSESFVRYLREKEDGTLVLLCWRTCQRTNGLRSSGSSETKAKQLC